MNLDNKLNHYILHDLIVFIFAVISLWKQWSH